MSTSKRTKRGGYLVATLGKFPGVPIPLLSDEECRARGIKPGRLPPLDTWSKDQQGALHELAMIVAEAAVRQQLGKQPHASATGQPRVESNGDQTLPDHDDQQENSVAKTKTKKSKMGAKDAKGTKDEAANYIKLQISVWWDEEHECIKLTMPGGRISTIDRKEGVRKGNARTHRHLFEHLARYLREDHRPAPNL